MNYKETIDWLYSQLPMFQRMGKAAYKAKLKTSIALSEALKNPGDDFPTVHIAGTNGKGSTAHYIASILQENGYKVGLHCSPHYFDFRERIKINGQLVDHDFVVLFIEKYRALNLDIAPSFFELTVLMAFAYFRKEKVDIAIIETGMGGRLDTTNIIKPLVSVITNIGLDHTQFLGDTIEKIALEKGGIIKKNTPFVLGEMDVSAMEVLLTVAEDLDAPVHLAGIYNDEEIKSPFQKENMATAIQTIEILEELDWRIREESIDLGLANVKKNTNFVGRWQQVGSDPIVILDSAHNVDGITKLIEGLQEYVYNNLRMVVGVVDDKDVSGILSVLPKDCIYYFCKADIPRAKDQESLWQVAKDYDLKGSAYKSVADAYNFALKDAQKEDLVIVAGSIFVVGEVLQFLDKK